MSDREIVVGETTSGTDVALPVVQLLTGRGFVTGKSGSGKSNTASVIAEELLESGFPLLIVDTDGEYYGLKEEYEMLHAGADEECDIQIGPEHAEQMAELALEENVPVILDVSGYLDEEVANDLLRETARQLFVKEKKLKKPFLLVVEEVHEYIPEGGGVGETGKMLIKIGKRGRKHGLGIMGISQRPADVKKDFITQANWLVWHRLTWENDTKVVGRIMDSEYADRVSDLGDGQAFVQTDWTDENVRRIQFRRKRTFDAGATPGLEDFERPDLKSVSENLVGDLERISERKERERNRVAELEAELSEREQRIESLKGKLEDAKDVGDAARRMADALGRPDTIQAELPTGGEELRQLHEELVELERERDDLAEDLAERDERIGELEAETDRLRRRVEELEGERGEPASESSGREESGRESAGGMSIIEGDGNDVEFGYTPNHAKGDEGAAGVRRSEPIEGDGSEFVVANEADELEELLSLPAVAGGLEQAYSNSRCGEPAGRTALAALIRDGPLETDAVAGRVGRSTVAVQGLLSELRSAGLVERVGEGTYDVADDVLAGLSEPVETE
ncbi:MULTISPECIES: helicase HerA domain-containing protein [Saliphagus]|uniref:Helicase HerA domain-containing protein n=1 Tax=Saliphagus infecundisoli TaxID=1849069 RepID=A0ABD5QD20_9EURY|nr:MULTISPECIES: DUF87 domain-containing protein [Saliphagus]